MMTNKDRLNRSVVVAAGVAGLVMLTYGICYRLLTWRLAAPGEAVLLPPEALARLPYQLGNWSGQDAPLDDEIVEATDTDQHLSRNYSRRNPPELVQLYIAYGVRPYDLAPHRPDVCYIGAGYARVDRRLEQLVLADGTELTCNVSQFSRGALEKERRVVLYYYIVNGRYYQDVSALRKKAWHVLFDSGSVDHIAQVQVVAPVAPSMHARAAEQSVLDFAAVSASSILSLFESTGEQACSDEGLLDEDDVSVEGR